MIIYNHHLASMLYESTECGETLRRCHSPPVRMQCPTIVVAKRWMAGLGTPSPFFRGFESALQQGLERSDTFLSASDDTLSQEPITKLAFPPWRAIG